ncbi:hypothetical protein ACFL7D_11470, partial [candidate division KSB1 bacterium]
MRCNLIKILVLYLLAVLFCFSCSSTEAVRDETEIIDNYTLIKEKLTDVFGEIENNLSGESPVFLKASANFNQKQSLLENSFNEHFSLKGKSVYISPAETFLDLLKMKQ